MFDVTVTNASGNTFSCVEGKITTEILRNSNGKLRFEFNVPIVNVVTIWHPGDYSVPAMRLPWSLDLFCGASTSLPLLVFLNRNYSVRCALGLTNGIDDTHITCKMNQENCCYEVSFTISIVPETEPFDIFYDDSGNKLTSVLQSYREKIMKKIPEYPQGAWKPVYCTWYAVHAALTEEYMRNNADEASRLGFGTFIVDDGWCYDESKRVTPETLPDWYRDIGDWKNSEQKLPNLKNTVDCAKKSGLNYMFWVAPFFAGRRSSLNDGTTSFLTDLQEGQRIYDPADESVNQKTKESIFNIFKAMNLDGVKIDFIDMVQPSVDRPRCRYVKKYLETLIEKIRDRKPDALIEFRQKYATPVNASLATAFRAGDVPFDYVENYSRCVQLRLILGDKIPIHADPVYFNDQEALDTVGCHMIASLIGVPMLSMDLTAVSQEHKSVIKNYLDFYQVHQKTLNYGHWDFTLRNGFAINSICHGNDETIIFLTDDISAENLLQNYQENVVILNMSSNPLVFDGKIYDAAGNLGSENKIPSGGRGER